VYQFDTRTGEIEQKYEQHTGVINSITFIEENQRFVTTSDDKSMRCWEFGIPIVIKYVSEPDMQTITAVSLSYNRKYWLK
jgi:pre-mRNA-processing factor 17